ncbi:tellurite resistance TerB C-terminal domain-containing protein [Leptothermofonsia sp. ETS-13]|uniref:tellurite resistance TerB C-terminal domain-containing protein n=1 Tax=Leptothermofonsia sp. ETS-13 TaxID=3035696 RepID=UPI003BA1F9BA
MLRNRLLLGFVAFGISFGISWAADRNLNRALVSGLTTLPAAVIASTLVDRQHQRKMTARIANLKGYIRTLRKQQAETYKAYVNLMAERERLALEFKPVQAQAIPLQLPPAPALAAKKPISWDLSSPVEREPTIEVKPYELPTEIQTPSKAAISAKQPVPVETELNQVLVEAAAAKRKIEANLKSLQAELSQLQTQVNQQRQARDKLSQELADLQQQKQQLAAEAVTLQKNVNDLKRCQKELAQYLSEAEVRRKELDQGTNSLQIALKQLQAQVSAHQEDLRRLEIQIGDRRQQKEELEQQLAVLNSQHQALKERPVYPVHSPAEKNGNAKQPNPVTNGASGNGNTSKQANSHPKTSAVASSSVQAVAQPLPSTSEPVKSGKPTPEPAKSEKPAPELADGWDELIEQLPEYEFQVLRAIVEQNNPAGLIKKIAEDNLTMPEMLIDSINERALETVGDIIIEPGSGPGSAAIAREHLRAVKKLIKNHG